MSKPNKNSKGPKANRGDWTPIRCICLYISFWTAAKPNTEPEIGTWVDTEMHTLVHAYGHMVMQYTPVLGWFDVLLVLPEWCPGGCKEAEQARAPLLRLCLHWWFPDASWWLELFGTLWSSPAVPRLRQPARINAARILEKQDVVL